MLSQPKKESEMKRSAGHLVFEATLCLPNGDLDADNYPRRLNDGRGWITDVCVKSKIRDLLKDHNSPVFIALQEKLGFDPERFHILESADRGTGNTDPVAAMNVLFDMVKSAPLTILERFFDVRVFGCNILQEGKAAPAEEAEEAEEPGEAKPKKKKEKAPKNSAKFLRTGPVTFCPAVSVAPVVVREASITKRFPLQEKHLSGSQGTIAPGAKKFVEHAVYCMRICVNPHLARHTNCTDDDIAVLKELVKHIFTFSTSCSRPGGSIRMIHEPLWRDHDNVLGSFDEFAWWNAHTPKVKSGVEVPQSIDDYDIPPSSDLV
jgi:CRISPR/Cas system type I-B associated protein Csh2 (Cas7 group RAMP superfamily)